MDGAKCVDPYLLFGPVARYPLDCWAYVADGAVGTEDRDDIGGVLHQGAEPLLALSNGVLDPLAFGDVADHTREQPFPILMSLAHGHLYRELATVFAQPY